MGRHDILAPEVRDDPYPFYARLRDEAAAVQVDPFGLWIVTGYDDVVDVLKRTDEFSSTGNQRTTGGELFGGMTPATIITSDNPTHDRLRSILHKRFTPRRVSTLQARVEDLTQGLLRDIRHQREFDLVTDFTIPLPVIVIAEMLGIESARFEDFKIWSNALMLLMNGAEGEEEQALRAVMGEFAQYLMGMADHRRSHPAEDLIGTLVDAEKEADRISAPEVLGYCVLLLAAGNETTTNLIGGMTLALLQNPEQLSLLRSRPELIENAVEEGLRYCSPVQGLFRKTLCDARVGEVTIPEGSEVMVCYAAANRDPSRFDNPNQFDITRHCKGHLAFGLGLHFCLGANLARREARVAIERLLPLLEDVEPTFDRVEWVDSWFLRGPRSLPFRRLDRAAA